MEYAIIDVETTGHPLNKITDVAVFSTDGEKLIREFHSLVNPGVNIPYNITRLTGISNDTVQNAPYFHEIAKQLLDATRDCVFVAHNVNFDFEGAMEFNRLSFFVFPLLFILWLKWLMASFKIKIFNWF